ncbi:MAG TPA: DnaD domain protein [Bacilli bacterium]|nr:DnaD domain protein [Bacilli bacterium]
MINYEKLLNAPNYTVSSIIIEELVKQKLNLSEFLIIVYFLNEDNKIFDIVNMNKRLGLSEKEILESFNTLVTKKLISLDVKNDKSNHMVETISLEGIYRLVNISLNEEKQEEEKENIFDIFEKEFNRKLTPMEYEIVNAWLENDTSEELILGALRESIYNGVKSFRYIDKIIYEWGKKGFKTMDDVKNHINNKSKESKQEELFDYDWLDDNEV